MSAIENFPRITPFLWFDTNAEEAVDFYLTVFQNSRHLEELRLPGDSPGSKGSILTIAFELDGQKFTALNGGPLFKFNESISFFVRCDHRMKSMTTGRSSPPGALKAGAAGSRTNSVSPGRSSPRACPTSSNTLRQCKRCCR